MSKNVLDDDDANTNTKDNSSNDDADYYHDGQQDEKHGHTVFAPSNHGVGRSGSPRRFATGKGSTYHGTPGWSHRPLFSSGDSAATISGGGVHNNDRTTHYVSRSLDAVSKNNDDEEDVGNENREKPSMDAVREQAAAAVASLVRECRLPTGAGLTSPNTVDKMANRMGNGRLVRATTANSSVLLQPGHGRRGSYLRDDDYEAKYDSGNLRNHSTHSDGGRNTRSRSPPRSPASGTRRNRNLTLPNTTKVKVGRERGDGRTSGGDAGSRPLPGTLGRRDRSSSQQTMSSRSDEKSQPLWRTTSLSPRPGTSGGAYGSRRRTPGGGMAEEGEGGRDDRGSPEILRVLREVVG